MWEINIFSLSHPFHGILSAPTEDWYPNSLLYNHCFSSGLNIENKPLKKVLFII
jgi:hypothetical protein